MTDANDNFSGLGDLKLRVSIRFELEAGVAFGKGRYKILREVEKHGSLKKAAEKMGMSYRAAWGKVKKSEKLMGQPLIEKTTNKGGYHLTEFGNLVLNSYEKLMNDTESYLGDRYSELFNFLDGEK